MEKGDLTYRVNGCAMKVHNKMGSGFSEKIYKECLAIELKAAGIKFVMEKEQKVFYDGFRVGSKKPDFIVEDEITVEIKAIKKLEDADLTQAKIYLKVYGFEKGLLINFGSPRLEHKLIFKPAD